MDPCAVRRGTGVELFLSSTLSRLPDCYNFSDHTEWRSLLGCSEQWRHSKIHAVSAPLTCFTSTDAEVQWSSGLLCVPTVLYWELYPLVCLAAEFPVSCHLAQCLAHRSLNECLLSWTITLYVSQRWHNQHSALHSIQPLCILLHLHFTSALWAVSHWSRS